MGEANIYNKTGDSEGDMGNIGRRTYCEALLAAENTVSKKTGSCWGDFFLGGRLHLREQN